MLEWLLLFVQIMIINIVLSGDNAVVIALASKNLPAHQRSQAIWWGAFGAVALRLVLTVAAVALLGLPFIQAGGALLLMWIAFRLLCEEDAHANVQEAATLGKAIRTIIAADFVMSLDNVLAIAAKAQGQYSVLILGIALSIPVIVWGSGLVVRLLDRFPAFVYAGAGILGYTAGEMLVGDSVVQRYALHGNAAGDVLIPICTAVVVLAAGFAWKRVRFRSRTT